MKDATGQGKRNGQGGAKTSTLTIIGLILLLLLALGAGFYLLVLPHLLSDDREDWYDPAAEIGNLPGMTAEEIQAELDKIVEEGMFNISISSIIVFADGQSQGQARIDNIAANNYNMKVAITVDGEDEPVYESKGLAPGQYIEYITLTRDLPPGEYSATALFTAYTPEELQKVGQAAAKITLVVEQ